MEFLIVFTVTETAKNLQSDAVKEFGKNKKFSELRANKK